MAESLEKIVGDFYLNGKNAEFTKNGDLVALKIKGADEEKTYDRVILVRNFPFQYEEEYITVLDTAGHELGILKKLSDFPEGTAEILKTELERRYFMPKICEITKVKEKMGFANWTAKTDFGTVTFSIRDAYKNIVKLPGGRCIITDVDGNRYEIPKLSELDKKSYKRIELII